MKVKILQACSHRVSSAVSMDFAADSEVSIPSGIADALIDRKVAEAIVAGGKEKTATKEN